MDEEKHKQGLQELETLRMIFSRWLKSDVVWASEVIHKEGSTGDETEWDFLRTDWVEKLEDWLAPYLYRLYRTEYITKSELGEFGEWAYDTIKIMLEALYTLGGNNERRVE